MAPSEFMRFFPPPDFNLHDQGGSKNNSTKDAVDYVMKVKKKLKKTPDLYAKFREIMKNFNNFEIPVQEVRDKVANLFQGHDDVLLGFNVFLPEEHQILVPVHQPVPTPIPLQVQLQEALMIVNLIKARFSDKPSVFHSFLKVLELYKNHKSCQEIYQEVEHLFKDHPDLLNGFMRFLPITNIFPSWQAGSHKREDRSSDINVQILQPVKNERTSKDSKVSDASEGDGRESDPNSKKQRWENGSRSILHKSSDEEKEFLSGEPNNQNFKEIAVAHGGKNGSKLLTGLDEVKEEEKREKKRKRSEKRTRTPPALAKEKYNLGKPVHELNQSNCKKCIPSYRLLPENYSVPLSSHRTELDKSVLNDTCVLLASASEDYSFKHRQKNQYEESLFLCEDDRFEFDMLVESLMSAIQRIESLMKKMNEGSIDLGVPIEIEDYLTSMNLRCIEKLYGDHGLDAIDVLRQNIKEALPVLLGRLKQKLEELDNCFPKFNKVWSAVYAKNFHKSLDHRSFNLKQQDTKNLISSKALKAEIEESHENNLGELANLLEIGAKSQCLRCELSVSDASSDSGSCNKQHISIDQSTESIVSSPAVRLKQN